MRESCSNNQVIRSLFYGSLSSTCTTLLFQPLELVKTNIQLRNNHDSQILKRSTKTANNLVSTYGLRYLWRGTGASLLRSIPGVGLYYASLSVLQSNFSLHFDRPDDFSQAFYFGLIARSMVSLALSPVSVIKVRYESGRYKYLSLSSAIKDAYFKSGWVGVLPTILRDSIFSGIYYMCYTRLKLYDKNVKSSDSESHPKTSYVLRNFSNGIISGLIASIVTNPFDVVKTLIQVDATGSKTFGKTVSAIMKESPTKLFDGLAPRCLRRTLMAATTWTFYELFMTN